MPNTYTQIHIQCIFAVKYRLAMIGNAWKERLHQYITGIIQNHGHKMIAINTMPDHLHMFYGMRPNQSISDLMQIVKGESSEWINLKKITPTTFKWQGGFGAFSYDKGQINKIATYIKNQEMHHQKKPFLTEYREILKEFGVEYDERYLFKDVE